MANNEKCFCHFNGYKVKDADARKQLEEHAESIAIIEEYELPEIKAKLTEIIAKLNESPDSVTVAFNLTNAVTATTVNSYPIGQNFDSIITANDGYQFRSVIVKHGDVEIVNETFKAVHVSNTDFDAFTISIPAVSGDITVTAVAEAKIENLVLLAEEIDSDDIYNNGLGYLAGYRRSQSTDSYCQLEESETHFVTGAIQIDNVNVGTKFRFKNCHVQTNYSDGMFFATRKELFDMGFVAGVTHTYSSNYEVTKDGNDYIVTIKTDFSEYSYMIIHASAVQYGTVDWDNFNPIITIEE